MIEKLIDQDIKKTAKVYNKGLQMEIPKGFATLEETMKQLKKVLTFVYKENKKIIGLVSYKFNGKNIIEIDFICTLELRKGIGKMLMNKLADFSIKNSIDIVYSRVSSKDKRVINFYKSCGLKKYGTSLLNQDFKLYKLKAKPESIKKAINKKS